jgi:hypothetical protein
MGQEREESQVMDSWCRFSMRRWKPIDEVKTSGTGLSPAWPTHLPLDSTPATRGARRAGKRTQTLTLSFRDHGTCNDVSEPVWRKYTDGQKLTAEIHASGDVACGAL